MLLGVVALACLLLVGLLVKLLLRELAQYRARQIAETQSQRMEALGRLTGGVAHDFNNLLTPILGGLDLIRRRVSEDPRSLRYIDTAIASAERARALVSRLLSFARRQTLSQTDIDPGQMLEELRELLVQAAGTANGVEMEISPHLPMIHADRTQLELAILNLTINARDAMPDGGTIRVTATAVVIGSRAELPPGHYVAIAVGDQGHGMDEETLRRAVDPFFTTKAADKGTGLGLSMVHGFAAQSGGMLRIESRPGEGTTAAIILPAATTPAQAVDREASGPTTGTGRLLLVDDEEAVRVATAAMLTEAGYTPLQASSVDQALHILEEEGEVDAVLTDYLMPGRNGADLVREIRRTRPDMPILLITGYADAAQDIPSDVARLPKPYRSAELIDALNRLRSRA
jgi:nitrogen-specific signal transduction histidine kinase